MYDAQMKIAGFPVGLYETSSTRKGIKLGTIRFDELGCAYRWAKAGSSALSPGKLGVAAAINAGVINQAITSAVAIGEKSVALTVTAGAAYSEGDLIGGQFQVNDATGEAYRYPIVGNTALGASDTAITLRLGESIKVALTTSSEFSIIRNPWLGVTESTTLGKACGVPLVDVTAAYYYWAQTKGQGIALIDGTPAAGSLLQQSNGTAGAMEIYASGTITYKPVAEIDGTAGVAGEYKPVVYCID